MMRESADRGVEAVQVQVMVAKPENRVGIWIRVQGEDVGNVVVDAAIVIVTHAEVMGEMLFFGGFLLVGDQDEAENVEADLDGEGRKQRRDGLWIDIGGYPRLN